MLRETFIEIFERDLNKLITEIKAYTDESKLWIVAKEINNSAGNLCLHINGNLRHYIGAVLGNSGYERDRNGEFSKKNVSKDELLRDIEGTIEVVIKTLSELPAGTFNKIYPVEISNKKMTTDFLLIHLISHLNYHLGQVNYHRRLIGL
jgi:uncharacterized damage-inducible protein DinB